MGNILKKIIFTIILVLFTIFSINTTFSANLKNSQYIKLNPQSSNDHIKKYQNFFKTLKIYNWNIDGKYSSIKSSIINFQFKNKIISSKTDNWAGYIWPKTFEYFDSKYWPKFKRVYINFFWIKEWSFKNERCFVVSAYYSPLKWQKIYATNSYARDVRLNWNGTHWASWVWVYPWFIAAPSNYTFWTKIQLDWLWIWIVEDRWGAIVRKWVRWHECDRLDIWMGYGDEWLKRALKWGKKKVNWKIVSASSKITISFPTETREYLAKKIIPESKKDDLKQMQELFLKAKLYSWKIDGKYSSFKKSIIDFQIKHNIIVNKNDYAAGYIWPKTIEKLEAKYTQIFIIVRRKDIEKNKKKLWENFKIKENKNWQIPEKKEIKIYNTVTIKNYELNNILKKYWMTIKEKQELDNSWDTIIKTLNKKAWNNKKNFEINKKKIKDNIVKIIKKSNSIKIKKQLTYLKDIIK
jgi:3D (Asp-Asp-Asp) domain-containing protein